MDPLLCIRSVRQMGRIRAWMQKIGNIETDLYTLVNVHWTNLEISWAGYSPYNKWCPLHRPSNRWCPPKLLRRRIHMRVFLLVYISVSADRAGGSSPCLHRNSLDKFVEKWKILFFFLLSSRLTRHIIRDIYVATSETEYDTYTHLMTGWVWQRASSTYSSSR
jgi:hypothetical protein